MSRPVVAVRWSVLTTLAAATVAALVTLPVGGATAAARPVTATPVATPAPPASIPVPTPPVPSGSASAGSPASTTSFPPPPPSWSMSPCVPSNGTVRSVTNTSINFEIPGSVCYPQAIFNVTVYRSAADAATYTNAVARGMGTRLVPNFAVSGLSPATAYWYRFDGAPVAGPVYTSSSSASASPSNPAPSDPPPPVCSAASRTRSTRIRRPSP